MPASRPTADAPSAAAAPAVPRLMHVGELAERVQLSHRTVRYYDDEGLLTATARSAGNYRLYTEADVDRMLAIRRMKPLRFTLEQMAQVLRILDAVAAGEAAGLEGDADVAVSEFIDQATERRAKLLEQVAAADVLLEELERARDAITGGGARP